MLVPVGRSIVTPKEAGQEPLNSGVLCLDVVFTSAIGLHLVQKCSIPKSLHGDGHESVPHDERNNGHVRSMKHDSKMKRCRDEVLGDQSPWCRVAHCGWWCDGCNDMTLRSEQLV